MDPCTIRPALAACVVLLLSGCATYEARPLKPQELLARVDRERRGLPATDAHDRAVARGGADETGVTLAEAAAWMLRHGPDVREAVAAYRTALARARIATPLPNPGLEVGPEYGFGSDVGTNRLVPFGSLSITIPLGSRLSREDDLNRSRAEVLRIDGVARHRELYLELRRLYARLAVARRIRAARRELLEAATRTSALARRLVSAGQATALDVALFELERGRSLAADVEARAGTAERRAQLARLVGVHAERFANLPQDALPELPTDIPSLAGLRKELTTHHAELARLRARYEEAENALRLEIARQYPDLVIGPSGAGEAGERKTTLGLALGITLPLFDRNQQGIAEARERREEIRARYEAAANRALADLERALAAVRFAAERHGILRDTVLPQARSGLDLARRSLAAGSGDALRLLDAERSLRQVRIDVLEADLAVREAWIGLERAVGRPLLRFPTEARQPPGAVPPGLEAEGRAAGESADGDEGQEEEGR